MKLDSNNFRRRPGHNETDVVLLITACLGDTILKPLHEYASERNMFGYLGALTEVSRWAKEFYFDYEEKTYDWDEFEESDFNIYNSLSWDDFLICWANDRLRKFKSEAEKNDISSGNGINSLLSVVGNMMRPCFQFSLACSIRSLQEEKWHDIVAKLCGNNKNGMI